jgi:hypothetical protein
MLRHKISLLTTCIGLFFLVYFLKPSLSKLGVDEWVLYVSNILLLLVSMVNLRLVENGLKNSNPHVFVRSVIGGMTLKMLVLLTAIMVYAGTSPKDSVLFAKIFYVIYLILELSITLKLNKKNHA